ncbi:MAG: tRNA-binding protein [Rhodospirillales bacterium]|nr:MAG: tRNA-binding protein [Rhodospirillales bacterium]
MPDEAGAPRATIAWDDFERVDIRVGTIVEARPFEGARKPAIQLVVDFGPAIGRRKSSAQLTTHYAPESLVGRQVAAVVNFPPRQIGKFMSQVLCLGFPDADGAVVLVSPDKSVPDGGKLF